MEVGESEPWKGFKTVQKSTLLLVMLRATGAPFHQDPQGSLAEFASELPT